MNNLLYFKNYNNGVDSMREDTVMGPIGECKVCGQKHGVMRIADDLSVRCFRCDLVTRAGVRQREPLLRYLKEVETGRTFAPIYNPKQWREVAMEHGFKVPTCKKYNCNTAKPA